MNTTAAPKPTKFRKSASAAAAAKAVVVADNAAASSAVAAAQAASPHLVEKVVEDFVAPVVKEAKAKKSSYAAAAKKEAVAKVEVEVEAAAPVPVAVAEEKVSDASSDPAASSAPLKKRRKGAQDAIDLIQSVVDQLAPVEGRSGSENRKTKSLQTKLNKASGLVRKLNSSDKKTRKQVRSNSGITKKMSVSAELVAFTGWNHEELKSRTEVTKFICDYVKQHNLAEPSDRRLIHLDASLRKLLKYSQDAPIRYCDIQKYIGHLLFDKSKEGGSAGAN